MPKVSIVIVTHNAREIIKECLNSVYAQDFKDFEVIVVDNDSRDGTKEFIRENFPQAKLVENGDNLGFCQANNQGIEIAKGEFTLTLNSDVILENNFLSELLKTSKNLGSNFGMLSPKILKMDKKTIDSTGLILTKARRFYNRGSGEIDSGQYDDKREIFGPCAAAALYKREMLEQIKIRGNSIFIRGNSCSEHFDNDFFFLVEDVDLAWRANLSGWRGYFIPQAKCYHLGNSSGMDKKLRQYLSFRNRYFMMLKNERLGNFLKNLLFILPYDVLRFFKLIITNRHITKAIFEIVYLLGKIFKKRNFGLTR
jgi:GT2 family glycosyltransferase